MGSQFDAMGGGVEPLGGEWERVRTWEACPWWNVGTQSLPPPLSPTCQEVTGSALPRALRPVGISCQAPSSRDN